MGIASFASVNRQGFDSCSRFAWPGALRRRIVNVEGEVMMAYFKNPQNGYVEKVSSWLSWLGFVLFGPIYFIYKGVWRDVLISFLLLGLAWGLSIMLMIAEMQYWYIPVAIVYLMGAISIYPSTNRRYRMMGWVRVDKDGNEIVKDKDE